MEFSQEIVDYFNTLDVNIILKPDSTSKKIISIEEFGDFLLKEIEFWNNFRTNSSSSIKDNFNEAFNFIINATRSTDTSNVDRAIDVLKRRELYYSESTIMQFVKSLLQTNIDVAAGAFDYLLNKPIQNLQGNKSYLTGVIEAINWEKADRNIDNYKNTQFESFENIKKQANEILGLLKSELKNAKTNTKSFNSSFEKEMGELKNQATTEYEESLNDIRSKGNQEMVNLQTFLYQSEEEVERIKKVYAEQLRLEKPADYWNDLEIKYNAKGKMWVLFSVILTILLGIYLTVIMYTMPDIFKLIDTGTFFSGIRGIIILTIVIAAMLYLLRLFVKLATSSFHLSRDAKERYQLTYIYLALINENNAIDEKERLIIIESLFSRADTGLLKGDSSPSFPISGLSQIKDLLTK